MGKLLRPTLAGIVTVAAIATHPALADPEKGDNLKAFADRYYWIDRNKVDHFECQLQPDWRALLASQGASGDSLDQAVAKLNQLVFHISFGPNRDAKITHNEIPAENDQVAEGLKQVYSGIEQMSTGFFQTFALLAYNRTTFDFLDGAYSWNAEDQTAAYAEANGSTKVKIGFVGDRIRQIDTATSDFNSTLFPQYASHNGKYRLDGYDATYVGSKGEDHTVLSVSLGYQSTEGFDIPASLDLSGSYNSSPLAVKIAFTGCSAVH